MMKMLMVLFVIAVGSCQGGRVRREDEPCPCSTITLGSDPTFGNCLTPLTKGGKDYYCFVPYTFGPNIDDTKPYPGSNGLYYSVEACKNPNCEAPPQLG